MDTEKDYYAVLGVLPSIDDIALTAVYRALLKKYHPDVSNGSKKRQKNEQKKPLKPMRCSARPKAGEHTIR